MWWLYYAFIQVDFSPCENNCWFSFRLPCALKIEKDLKSSAYDGIVVITTSDLETSNHDELLKGSFTSAAKVHTALYLPTNVKLLNYLVKITKDSDMKYFTHHMWSCISIPGRVCGYLSLCSEYEWKYQREKKILLATKNLIFFSYRALVFL